MKKNIDTFMRWGMPGWTLIMGFLLFVVFDYVSANDPTMFNLINIALNGSDVWQLFITAILVAGAGIPLGFIIYQVYFYLRWNSPVSENGFLPPMIVGRVAELKDTRKDLEENDLALGKKWRKKLLLPEGDHRSDWYYLGPLVADALVDADSTGSIYERHNYVMNMLHSLGASHLGLAMGFLCYMIFKWKISHTELWWGAVAFVTCLIMVALLSKEDLRNLGKDFRVYKGVVIEHPAELFLAFLFFIYFVVNPGLNILLPFQLPLIFCWLVAGLWAYSVKNERWFVLLLALTVTGLAYLIRWLLPANLINWPIILSILIFSSISLTFLKNRQNAREQMVTMEYYYLQRYFEKLSKKKNSKTKG
jgi:hypothetical protein